MTHSSPLNAAALQEQPVNEDGPQEGAQLQAAFKSFWLSTALNSAADGIAIVDPEGRVRFLNPVAQKLTGVPLEQASGQHYRQVLVFEYRGAPVKDDLIRLATLNEEPLSLGQDLVLVSRDGQRRNVEAEISSGSRTSGAFGSAVFTFRDITQRKWEEHQHRQEQAIRAVERLAETTAHTLNNLLTTILGNSELLLITPGLTEEQRGNLEPVIAAAQDAAGVVRQLSAISRTKFAARREIDVNRFIQAFLPVATWIPGRITVTPLLGTALPEISANQDQLEQILYNLIQNAVDAIPETGEITISTELTSVEPADRYDTHRKFVTVSVRDTGEGMTEETRECIFEPFFSSKKTGSHPGLGLSITQGIVRDYKGLLEVSSQVGVGTEVRFSLPCAEPDPFAYMDELPSTGATAGVKTILLVEDDDGVRRMVRQILERNDYQIIEAPDGDSALSLAQLHDGRIDLLVTDVGMPGISGPELVRNLGPLHPETKFLLISGFLPGKLQDSATLPRGVEFLQKPFTHKDLLATIHGLL